MDNIDLTLDEISPIEDINISDNSKLQDVSLGFGEVIYVDNGVKDHEKLNNLDYENSGHTGFASSEALSNVEERVKSLEEIGIPEDGLTPYIGENGNWFIGEEDTGVQAEGQDGKDGTNGVDGVGLATITQGEAYENNGYTITPITFTKTDDTFHTFGIKAKDGKSENLELYATNEYVNELDNANKDSIQGINDKIGAVEENKTVVEMIADAQAEATYDDTALSNRVTNLENNSATHEEVAGVKSDLDNYKEDNDKAVKSNSDAISVLNGNSMTEGSVDQKVNKAINEFAQAVTSNDTIDTFAEVISYVATHGKEFSELVGEVDKNTKSVETLNGADNVVGSVDYKIKSAIANENLSQYATDSELKGVSDRVKAIEDDYATDTDFTNLNNQVQGMYTNAQIDSAVSNAQSTAISTASNDATSKANTAKSEANSYTDSKIEVINEALDGKQPSGDYALNSDIPTKVSELTNDSGYITGYTESDPTVPSWAKQSSKPTYTYSEITEKPTLSTVATSGSYNDLSNKPTIPSIAGLASENYVDTKVANLVNSAPETLNTLGELATAIQNHEDEYDALLETVGNKANKSDLATVATSGNYNDLSNKPIIPSKTSQLDNDSGFLTSAPVTSVNGKTGAVSLSKGDVGLGNVDNVKQYSASNPPPYPVTSVNGETGAVTNFVKDNTRYIQIGKNASASTASSFYGIAIGSSAKANDWGINIGTSGYSGSTDYGATGFASIAIGADSYASEGGSVAIGATAQCTARDAVQLYSGTNSTEGTLQFRDYTLVNADGGVPTERLFKDTYVEEGFDGEPPQVSITSGQGIYVGSNLFYLDGNDNVLASHRENRTLPIVAGNGISIATNDSGKAEISSKGMLCITIANSSSTATYCELQFQIPNIIGITTRETKQPISRVVEAVRSAYDVAMIPCTGFFYASSAYCFATAIALSSTTLAIAGYKFTAYTGKPTYTQFTAGLSGAVCTLSPSL